MTVMLVLYFQNYRILFQLFGFKLSIQIFDLFLDTTDLLGKYGIQAEDFSLKFVKFWVQDS